MSKCPNLGKSMYSRLRHGVHHLEGPGQSWETGLAMNGPRDILFLLTFAPRTNILRSLLKHVRTTRMRVVTVTDHAYTFQAARYFEVVLPCHTSRYGLLSIIRLVAVAYFGRNRGDVCQ